MLKAPNGDALQGTAEIVEATYPVRFYSEEGSTAWDYTGGESKIWDEGAIPKQLDGSDFFLDESGNEWPLHHLIPEEADPLSTETVEAIAREVAIGEAYEAAKKLRDQLNGLYQHHQVTFGIHVVDGLYQEYLAARVRALALRARDLAAQEAAGA